MPYSPAKKLATTFTFTSSKILSFIGAIALSASSIVQAAAIIPAPPVINAKGFILLDYATGKVIAEGNADALLAPASLTKMMTSYVVSVELEAGNISNDDQVTISPSAYAQNPVFKGSSLMWLEVDKKVPVHELIKGLIISSGNDAAVALSEHVAGSESAFADLMNAHAQQLGMNSSFFENSHGLHSQQHTTTPRDMATLAVALIRDAPEEYLIYKQKSYTFNNIKTFNRNTLLWEKSMNVDGLKTGHTSQAGYSLVTSATKGDMRLVTVVMGADSARARKVESKKLLNYGFRFYETFTPYKAGEKFVSNRVWMGDVPDVDLGILVDTPITIPRGQRKNLKAEFKLDQQLTAPLAKGDVVGKLFLELDGEKLAEYPLVTLQEINEGSMFSRLLDYVKLQFASF